MSSAAPPCILHLDADAFFASVEQRDDPQLRGRPVVVGTGVVASCSYEARNWGVRTGMRLSDARRLCHKLLVLPGDYRRYEQAARRMLAVCLEQTPRVEVPALDDLYLDLTQPDVDAAAVAGVLRGQIKGEVGLNTSAGVGTSKLVAAVATQDAKERRTRTRAACSPLVVVPAGGESAYLAPWPVETLPGVGPKLLAWLERLNINRVGQLADVPLSVLCGLFGERGRVLRDRARGVDPRPVEPYRSPQSVSRCTSFDPRTSDHDFLGAMLDHLLERAASWLRFSGMASRGLTLTLRYGDYRSEVGRETFRPPCDDETRFKEAARDRFARLYQRRLPLRLLGVELSPLQSAARPAELFPDAAVERARRLAECKDAIRRQFGFMALLNGSALVLNGRLEKDRENYRLRTPCLTR
jgi:DNA polymerase IV